MSCPHCGIFGLPKPFVFARNSESHSDSVKKVPVPVKRGSVNLVHSGRNLFADSISDRILLQETGRSCTPAGEVSPYTECFRANRCVHTYRDGTIRQSLHSSGTYVHCEASENSLIWGLATASIPVKPHTRRPAGFVTVLQCSRLYLP